MRLYNSDLRLWIPEHRCGTYADLMVVNGEPEFNGDRTDEILNSLPVVEVLSPPLKPAIELKSSENIAIAFRAKDEVRLGIGLRGHRAYLTFLRTAISC